MSFIRLLFSSKGRVTRRTYWLFSLAVLVLRVFTAYLDVTFETYDYQNDIGLFSTLFTFLALIPIIAVSIKRFHDRNDSAWNAVMLFIPFLNLLFLFMLAFMPGTKGPNKYGPDPREKHISVITDEPLVDQSTRGTTYGI